MKNLILLKQVLAMILALVLIALVGSGSINAAQPPQQNSEQITARMLVQPNALMGPSPNSFAWSPNGATLAYVDTQDGHDVLFAYDAATKTKRVLLDPGANPNQIDLTSTEWSPQGDKILFNGATSLWLLDPKTGKLQALGENTGAKTSMEFSPDGAQIAYALNNDLYTIRIGDGKVTRLTTDGSDTVFNGTLDWVYNEELATRNAQPAYAWSPDGKWMIHLRLDESQVQNHFVTDYQPVPPTLSYTRYPVAGTANPKASLHMIELSTGKSTPIPLSDDVEYIMPFFTWFPESSEAVFVTENRAHTDLELMAWNPTTGKGRTLVKETDKYWVNENSYAAPIFLDGGKQFLWLSERDGFMHLYLISRDGKTVKQLTQGNWMIDSPAWNVLIPGKAVYVDPEEKYAYFSTTKNSPLERQVYRVEIASGKLEQASKDAGFHFGALSGDGKYLVDQFSDVSTPTVTTILKSDGTPVEVLSKAAGPSLDLPNVTREFVTIKAHDGADLYAQIVKPENFDAKKKYPVVIHWYGGPTLQLVSNRYGATNIFNHIERDTLYTQAGFIVWRLDNRGSFGRGHAFETPIYKDFGKAAFDDQLAGVEYLKTLPYVDATRIGTDGKSFGGFLTLYALIHKPEIFKAGVAGSGPTDWSYYDTIYTERYMQQPSQNKAGYDATNIINRAADFKVTPLIIHGLNDTNVHLQNSVNLIQQLEHIDKPFLFIPLPNSDHHYGGDGLATVLAASTEYFVEMIGGASGTSIAAADPLPSWNEGPAKSSILKFVAEVTNPSSANYVAPADRVAVFDNDGTLWTEKPIPAQGAFVFQRINELAPQHPEWKTTQPYEAVLEKDMKTLESLTPQQIEELVFATHAGMTETEFEQEAKAFLDTAKHPRFNVLYTQTIYQPMLELLAYLQQNGFKTFVVSGGGVEFMRAYSEQDLGIARDDMVGSMLDYKFQQTEGGNDLYREAQLDTFDDNQVKPVNIQRHIGRRPIMAVGNSDGDLQMLQYAGGDKGPYLNLLIVHDDAQREYAYTSGTDKLMTAAAQSPWMFVSMKKDFKEIFPWQ